MAALTRSRTSTGNSHLHEEHSIVTAATAMMAGLTSWGQIPHGARAPGNGARNSRSVTVRLSPHVVGAFGNWECRSPTQSRGYGSSQPAVLQQMRPQIPPPTLHPVPIQKQEEPSKISLTKPGRIEQIRVMYMEGNPHLELLSKHMRGRIKVPSVTGFNPVEIDLLPDSGLEVTTMSQILVANMPRSIRYRAGLPVRGESSRGDHIRTMEEDLYPNTTLAPDRRVAGIYCLQHCLWLFRVQEIRSSSGS